jgi:hypothetical protein
LTMMRAGFLTLCLCAFPAIASAQMQWTDKGFVTFNGGVQSGSHDLTTSSTFTLYDETASVDSAQQIKGGGFFDIGGAYRVWGRNLLAGVFISHVTSDADVAITGSIPDPVFFDRPRTVNQTVSDAGHSETAIHIDAVWMIPVANKIDLGVFAGPTIFLVKQDAVAGLDANDVSEPGPTLNSPVNDVSKTTAGFNLGVDLQYLIGKKWGVGGLARYSWGSTSIVDGSEKLTVGGFQIGAGARVRF